MVIWSSGQMFSIMRTSHVSTWQLIRQSIYILLRLLTNQSPGIDYRAERSKHSEAANAWESEENGENRANYIVIFVSSSYLSRAFNIELCSFNHWSSTSMSFSSVGIVWAIFRSVRSRHFTTLSLLPEMIDLVNATCTAESDSILLILSRNNSQ